MNSNKYALEGNWIMVRNGSGIYALNIAFIDSIYVNKNMLYIHSFENCYEVEMDSVAEATNALRLILEQVKEWDNSIADSIDRSILKIQRGARRDD